MAGQERDVLAPLGEGRQPYLHGPQPVEEIGTELPLLHAGAQVDGSGGEEAYVHGPLPVAAQPAGRPRVEDPQEFGLRREGQVADLVEEEGPPLQALEETRPGLFGSAECALVVPEELRFEELHRQRSAVDGEERAAGARARAMEGARRKLLPRPGGPGDEDRAVLLAEQLDGLEDARHGRGAADHPLEDPRRGDTPRAEEAGRLLEPAGQLVEPRESGMGQEPLPHPRRKELEEEVACVTASMEMGPGPRDVPRRHRQAGPEELDAPIELEEG